MNFRENWGSLTSLVLGVLTFASSAAHLTSDTGNYGGLVAGPVMVIGALIYRSAKKRRTQQCNGFIRIIAEVFGVLVILGLAFGQNELKERIATEPVSNFIIPIWALIVYAYSAFRSFSVSGNKVTSEGNDVCVPPQSGHPL